MTEEGVIDVEASGGTETGVAAAGTLASVTALFSASACCVLPLVLAGVGIGTGGLAAFVPYRWPLTIVAAVIVAAGWMLYLRRRRACAGDATCAGSKPSAATFAMLCVATAMVTISALWGFMEQPLMRALGGA